MSTVTSQSAPAAPAVPANLPLRRRPIDIFFIVMFSLFSLTCIISDAIPTLGIPQTATTTAPQNRPAGRTARRAAC